MNQPADQIRHALTSHEHLAPDASAVLARAEVLARTYLRRRRGAQAAGGAVLGAGLVAGGISLPGMLPGRADQSVIVQSPPAAGGVKAPVATPSSTPTLTVKQKRDAAYFEAGYGYTDALRLAELWEGSNEPDEVKAEAGRRLLAGETLPFRPGAEDPEAGRDAPDAAETRAVDTFFATGYDYDDAVELAELWKLDEPYQAKIDAGQMILDGQRLPIRP